MLRLFPQHVPVSGFWPNVSFAKISFSLLSRSSFLHSFHSFFISFFLYLHSLFIWFFHYCFTCFVLSSLTFFSRAAFKGRSDLPSHCSFGVLVNSSYLPPPPPPNLPTPKKPDLSSYILPDSDSGCD